MTLSKKSKCCKATKENSGSRTPQKMSCCRCFVICLCNKCAHKANRQEKENQLKDVQCSIDDIYSVLSVYGYGMNDSGKRFYDSDDGEVNLIYSSGYYTQPQVSVKAGETVTLKVGMIVDEGVKEKAVMTIMTVNGKAERTLYRTGAGQ